MSIVVDIIFALIIILMVVIFYIRGFLESMLQSLKLVLSATVGLLMRPVFFSMYESVGLHEDVTNTITAKAMLLSEKTETGDVSELLTKMKIPQSFIDKIVESIDKNVKDTEMCTMVGEKLGNFTVNCLSFITGFLLCFIAIMLFIKLTHIIKVIPVIGAIDKILGGMMGVVTGVCMVYIIIMTVFALSTAGVLCGVAQAVDESYIGSFIYDNIIITKYLW